MEIEKLMENAMLGGEADLSLSDSVRLIAAMRERYPKRAPKPTAESGKREAFVMSPLPESEEDCALRCDVPERGNADLSQSGRAEAPYLVVPRVVGG